MMLAFTAVFLITLGLAQIISTRQGWRAASLTGPRQAAGYGAGLLLLLTGAWLLPPTWPALWLSVATTPLALGLLLLAGSFVDPPPHPDRLFSPDHPAHTGCRLVRIPDGDDSIPGYWLTPRVPASGRAICIIPGAGDHKTMFKWRLVQALLDEGLTVLTIDPPGHGDHRDRLLEYPACLSTIPAVVNFMRGREVGRLGLVGISMGGALVMNSLAENPDTARQVDALAVLETPVELRYSRSLRYREIWAMLRAPVLSLLREISVRQMRQVWQSGGYRSLHNTATLITRFDPRRNIGRISGVPLLLVYSRRDPIAPLAHGKALQQAAPYAELLVNGQASHVTLTLLPEVNRQVARWLRQNLAG